MDDPRIVFAGTPAFALASLESLTHAGFPPVAVLTQPDRPAGRGRRLTASPVKEFAVAAGFEVLQPKTLKDADAYAELAALRPDVLLVAAYGLLLPQDVLDLPTHGCINVHASLLPRWRGAAPIQASILAGDEQSGISLMQMEAGLDTGPVFSQREVPIRPDMTAGELHDELARIGGELLVAELPAILSGERVAVPQDETLATHAGKIRTSDTELDWTRGANELARRVRAYNPVPGARFRCGSELIKCWSAGAEETTADAAPGQVIEADKHGIAVACGEGALRLARVQRPGRTRVSAAELARQLNLSVGSMLC